MKNEKKGLLLEFFCLKILKKIPRRKFISELHRLTSLLDFLYCLENLKPIKIESAIPFFTVTVLSSPCADLNLSCTFQSFDNLNVCNNRWGSTSGNVLFPCVFDINALLSGAYSANTGDLAHCSLRMLQT